MKPIQLTEKEQKILQARNKAMHESPQGAAFHASAETIADMRDGLATGWRFSEDFSQLIPPQELPNMNLPDPPKA